VYKKSSVNQKTIFVCVELFTSLKKNLLYGKKFLINFFTFLLHSLFQGKIQFISFQFFSIGIHDLVRHLDVGKTFSTIFNPD